MLVPAASVLRQFSGTYDFDGYNSDLTGASGFAGKYDRL